MTPETSLEQFFPAMFGDDRASLGKLLAEDVVWHVPPFTEARFGDVIGRDAVIEFLCGAGDEFYQAGSFSIDVEVQAVEEDRAIVLGKMHATTAKGGPYSNRYAFGFRFREGQICEAWELLDSVHFESQMGPI
jgi:ketosteroid isomerase-like protein